MDNSIYIMLSRQTALFRDMDVTANNIANVNTTGYHGEKMMFTDYLVKDTSNRRQMAFTQDVATYQDTRNGSMKVTGNPLDVGLMGSGYFTVETPRGDRYTRAGNFQLDGEGTLVTAEGYPVLDDGGQRIIFDQEDKQIVVGENGLITVDGEERAVLAIAEFANQQALTQEYGGMYRSDAPPLPAEATRVVHGALEDSNIQGVSEIVRLVELQRSTGSSSKFIETMYDLIRKANNAYSQQPS